MTPEEAINAATINSAYAMDLQDSHGSITVGKTANLFITKETPKGDTIGIRHKMFLSHSYDHRVVDGALGGMFVRKVADYLENFDIKSTI